MTLLALGLVLASSLCHATWNLLAKRVAGGPAFTFLFTWCEVVLYAPVVLILLVTGHAVVTWWIVFFMAGSALLHLGYFLALQTGYRTGDLSLVYPTARGTGPLLAVAAAILFFGERPSGVALAGALLCVAGIFLLSGDPRGLRKAGAWRAVAWAVLTGCFIASYTLWDKHAVSVLLAVPLVYQWGSILARALLLTPLGVRRWSVVRDVWQRFPRETLGVAILSPLAYLLVLTALKYAPVAYIAPAREMGILFGTFFGTQLLAEEHGRQRLAGAAVMVCGVLALAVG